MKIARITNDGTLMPKGEVIEYPSELEGGRNLWLNLSDIDLTDYAIGHSVEYPVNDRLSLIGYGTGATSRISLGSELNVVFSESSKVNSYVRGNIINLLPNTIYTLSYTLSHEGDMEGKTLFRLFNCLRYTSSDNGLRFSDVITTNDDGTFDFRFWQDNAGLISMNITFTISNIKLEIGDKATTWTPAPEDLGLTYDNYINYFTTGLKNNGELLVGEVIEVENRNVFFEDNFEDADINPLWEVEPFGNNPNALGVGIREGKFRMINTITGHGSFALFTKLPNVNDGKVIISFDWMSYNKTTNVHYRGSQVAIRKNVLSRANTYGTSTYDDNILIIRAYQSENASWNNFVIPSVAYEISSYKIILDIDKNKISVYNNGVLVGVEEKEINLEGYYLEFAYGGYSLGTYSLIDNVNIVVKENIPAIRMTGNTLEINELIEGGV